MKNSYLIERCSSKESIEWDKVPHAELSDYRWLDNGYQPRTYAQLVLVEGFGFVLRMTCVEQNPRAVFTNTDDFVCFDSCMEFFAQFAKEDNRYVNIEMNARGTTLSAIGPDRYERSPVIELTGSIWKVTGEILPDSWSVTAEIPFEKLCGLYGISSDLFVPGYTFRGNFYKCGDQCEVPHYGMWNPVVLEHPDFHRPEFFGELIIK